MMEADETSNYVLPSMTYSATVCKRYSVLCIAP